MASEDLEYEPMNHTDHFYGAFLFLSELDSHYILSSGKELPGYSTKYPAKCSTEEEKVKEQQVFQ